MRSRCFSFVLLVLLLPVAGACSSASSGGASDATGLDASSADVRVEAATVDSGADVSHDATATDTGAPNGDDDAAPEAAAAPTCGPPPARFTLLTGADAGLVRDNVTELVWMSDSMGGGEPPQTQTDAATYCTGRGMRLPTEDEAVALAAAYVPCAFGMWSTWTSTAVGTEDAWVVDYLGDTSPQVADNFPSAVLCVRGPGG